MKRRWIIISTRFLFIAIRKLLVEGKIECVVQTTIGEYFSMKLQSYKYRKPSTQPRKKPVIKLKKPAVRRKNTGFTTRVSYRI